METEQLSLAVEMPTTTPTPMPTLPPLEAEKPIAAPEQKVADKAPSLREGLEEGLRNIRDGRVRDPQTGKFAPKVQPNGVDPATVGPVAAAPAKVERPANMPKAWGADKAALWSAMTPEQQAYVTDRETQADQLHQNYGGLKKWHETALENGTTLVEAIEKMHAVEAKMYESPPDGIIAAMQAVGLDHQSAVRTLVGALQKLGVDLSGAQVRQAQPQQQQQQFRDPRVDQLIERDRANAIRQAQETVQKFRTDPANKYFEEVGDDIMREIGFVRSQGLQPDLKEIYDRVVWANPGTRQKLIAEQAAKAAEAQAQVKTQELTKARSASGSVAGTLPAAEGRRADKPASLRDDLTSKVRALMGSRV